MKVEDFVALERQRERRVEGRGRRIRVLGSGSRAGRAVKVETDDARPVHFVFGLRMCQLSTLTHRTSIRFLRTKLRKGIKKKTGGGTPRSRERARAGYTLGDVSIGIADRSSTSSSTYCLPDPRGRSALKDSFDGIHRFARFAQAICYCSHLFCTSSGHHARKRELRAPSLNDSS